MEQYLAVWAECWPSLFAGLEVTLIMAVTSLFCAFFLGIVLAVMGLSHIRALRAFYTLYLYVVRGVPVMIFALFLFFGVGALLHVKFNPLFAAIVTLTINASAYLAEIFRGGIQAVDVGQVEAARSLGLGYFKTLQKVVLPQAIKIMIPPIINQFITTLKDTSILSVISVRELTMNSQIIIARTYMPFEVYSFAALLYLVVIVGLSLLSKVVERRLQHDN
ncbi:MAG: amino acid ABC transporter permease [Selenomonas sp.]|jgi:polar amino acid transport system permease protein/polar amino acid transport system substrate-binding protein|nr:amino acid ABC transporter permease [Selenomonas sp.]MCI7331730.1 amino acid ABC transporter permease [Selenomonadaceae bacterium]MDD6120240.1 amino acid ABC transporter permease [Selenomonadaceae bacterium]MDD7056938.1 amino acid ABC transporter permease [Selenomonadaceae bacterium]MDY3915205.1 amino acid ABC transporter permease [Selenomonadaceae bacterium]